jgi:hypothetical protein
MHAARILVPDVKSRSGIAPPRDLAILVPSRH